MVTQQHVAQHDRACIDERIARNALLRFKLHDRIECAARRLPAHALPQLVSDRAQSLGQRENLGDRLNRESLVRIASDMHRAIRHDHGNAELVGRDPGERRDVRRDSPALGYFAHLRGDIGHGVRHLLRRH